MTGPSDDARARMNQMYRHQRRIYDVTRRYYLLGRTTLIDALRPPAQGTILEVGCGTAANLIDAAKRYPTARLHGFDISTEMLVTARQSVTRHGLAHRIALTTGDATAFDAETMFGMKHYDRIFTSYTLSMIRNWPQVLDAMARHLTPGGSMHVVDFGDCAHLPHLARKLLHGWLGTFDVTPRQDLDVALRECANVHDLELAFSPLFRGYAQLGVLTRARSHRVLRGQMLVNIGLAKQR